MLVAPPTFPYMEKYPAHKTEKGVVTEGAWLNPEVLTGTIRIVGPTSPVLPANHTRGVGVWRLPLFAAHAVTSWQKVFDVTEPLSPALSAFFPSESTETPRAPPAPIAAIFLPPHVFPPSPLSSPIQSHPFPPLIAPPLYSSTNSLPDFFPPRSLIG